MEELAMSERSHGVFFIGADRNISRLLLSVVNTLLMNITEGVQAWVEVESSTLRFSYGSFSLYWGQWLPDLRAAQTDVNTVVFTLTPDNVGQKLPEFRSQQEPEEGATRHDMIALLYDERRFYEDPEYGQSAKDLIAAAGAELVLDAHNLESLATAFQSIVMGHVLALILCKHWHRHNTIWLP